MNTWVFGAFMLYESFAAIRVSVFDKCSRFVISWLRMMQSHTSLLVIKVFLYRLFFSWPYICCRSFCLDSSVDSKCLGFFLAVALPESSWEHAVFLSPCHSKICFLLSSKASACWYFFTPCIVGTNLLHVLKSLLLWGLYSDWKFSFRGDPCSFVF